MDKQGVALSLIISNQDFSSLLSKQLLFRHIEEKKHLKSSILVPSRKACLFSYESQRARAQNR